MRPIAVIYENEAWMAPLFSSLERAGAPVERVFANAQASNFVTDAVSLVGFDPHERFTRYLIGRARTEAMA